jgi:hypothetical protein
MSFIADLLAGLPGFVKGMIEAFKKPDQKLEAPLGALDVEKAKQDAQDKRDARSGNVH